VFLRACEGTSGPSAGCHLFILVFTILQFSLRSLISGIVLLSFPNSQVTQVAGSTNYILLQFGKVVPPQAKL
jgi:hypothetical protein